jgi:hypothetical protein
VVKRFVAQITEGSLPSFGKDGDLPPGIYRTTLGDALRRFGKGSRQRVAVAQRLDSTETGQLARFVVFGSFISAKRERADVDVFLLMEDTFEMGQLPGEARVLFDHAAAQAHFGASVFWLRRRLAALGGEEQAIVGWQIKRDGTFRGIIEIVEEQTCLQTIGNSKRLWSASLGFRSRLRICGVWKQTLKTIYLESPHHAISQRDRRGYPPRGVFVLHQRRQLPVANLRVPQW